MTRYSFFYIGTRGGKDVAVMNSFTHFGVYGICESAGKLLVIHKGKGPYTGSYDLPGGRLEDNESLADAVVREISEETGYTAEVASQLGVFDFFVPYEEEAGYTHMHHIAALYTVRISDPARAATIEVFPDQDSLGIEWITLQELSRNNASPVAVLAAEWLLGGGLPSQAAYL